MRLIYKETATQIEFSNLKKQMHSELLNVIKEKEATLAHKMSANNESSDRNSKNCFAKKLIEENGKKFNKNNDEYQENSASTPVCLQASSENYFPARNGVTITTISSLADENEEDQSKPISEQVSSFHSTISPKSEGDSSKNLLALLVSTSKEMLTTNLSPSPQPNNNENSLALQATSQHSMHASSHSASLEHSKTSSSTSNWCKTPPQKIKVGELSDQTSAEIEREQKEKLEAVLTQLKMSTQTRKKKETLINNENKSGVPIEPRADFYSKTFNSTTMCQQRNNKLSLYATNTLGNHQSLPSIFVRYKAAEKPSLNCVLAQNSMSKSNGSNTNISHCNSAMKPLFLKCDKMPTGKASFLDNFHFLIL